LKKFVVRVLPKLNLQPKYLDVGECRPKSALDARSTLQQLMAHFPELIVRQRREYADRHWI
jgi:hypothetical protein